MSRISLRWRITLLMGALVFTVSVILTALSIHNASNNFVIPLVRPSADTDGVDIHSKEQSPSTFSLDQDAGDMPDGIYYKPEINLNNIENARQSFSLSSFFYMALVAAGSMLAAYFLAGSAMRPISGLNKEIEQIDGKSLSKRVPVSKTKDEIEYLSLSFNHLLERLEQEFERERQFSANAAHELRTPLAAIITSAQVVKLSDQVTLEEYQDNLDTTLLSARRLSSVVEGLLKLYQPERDSSFETVDIPHIFHEIQKEIEPVYSEKNIVVQYDLKAQNLTGDRLLLYRAFFNLIENAYKYSEKNGMITVASYSEGNEIIVSISDTGIGISADDIGHIFEPFYRADKSRSRKISGAGLGLSITKEIFNRHKANITVESLKDSGTAFKIYFK